ncbi:pyridoxal phosphate-dependent aminotransferase [Leucobacter sp. PH1c]|uniref:pyridoxal phosphate-dependent aminotransferase n=1 Tax=Leucobacter sp. PH1c TaxID=1397278 RepID=UPI000685D8F0|nr:pyridoxal phosphate-dependent aminotransferase [Leucobacter sp. PH1c]
MSKLARDYPASAIRAMFERVAAYDGVTKLTVGEPDFDTPEHIVEAAIASLRAGETRYSANAGIPEFRSAIARHYGERWGRELDERNVMVAVGGMEALLLALSVVLDRGDDILVPDPAYPNYHGQIHMLGARAIRVPLSAAAGFRLTAADVEARLTPNTRAVLVNSPSNPLGVMIAEDELRALARLADERNFVLISDEVYDRIVYDGRRHLSVAAIDPAFDRFLIVNSLSKSFAMTGWRSGFVVGPASLIEPMPRMQEGITSCLPVFIQRAGIAALEGPESATQRMVDAYERRRDLVVAGIRATPGLDCIVPEGAFYLFADIRGTGRGSDEFANGLLEEQRVAVIPGTAFGESGEGFIRISFAANEATIQDALAGIGAYAAELG